MGERFQTQFAGHGSALGCSFFAYRWKCPAYSGAFSLTIDSLASLPTIGAFSLTILVFLLTVGVFLLTVGKCVS